MKTTDWVADAIFYQIFPDRFRNGNKLNDPDNTKNWDDLPPSSKDFYGGDLEGIIENLDYIKDLGVNAIYLTPIFKSPSNHKYDTEDYYTIDPHFGNNKTFRELVHQIHKRGMRIILDGVFNHCGWNFFAFQDVLKKGNASKYWEWFTIDKFPIEFEPEPTYRCWAGVKDMPEFNTDNPEVRKYLLNVVRYWIEEYDIDGWRLDTVEYLEPSFVKEIRKVAKETKEDAYVLGEVVGIASSWFKGGGYLDGVMNYKLWETVVEFFAKGTIDAQMFNHTVRFIRLSYPKWANYSMYNLIGSHDRARFMTISGMDDRKVTLALSFLFTYIGAPAIFYGDEIGMMGENDPDCRRPFPWDESKWNKKILSVVKNLSKLRNEMISLRRGNYIKVYAKDRTFIYLRSYKEESTLITINASENISSIKLSLSPKRLILGNASKAGIFLELPPMSFGIWEV